MLKAMQNMRGQGSTEYLVLLAIVLIIALVAIGLLGFFPGIAGDAKKTQSDSYWRGEARPFAIYEHAQSGAAITFAVQNQEPDILTLTNVSIAQTASTNQTYYGLINSSVTFAGGERKVINGSISALNCTSGSSYTYDIKFNYTSSSGIAQVEASAKPLIGRCQ